MPQEQSASHGDADMEDVGAWDAGREGQLLDEEAKQAECVEVDFGDDDDVPEDDDEDEDIGDNEEIGVVPENEIYSDDEKGPKVDDALAKVHHKDSVLSVAICPTDRRILLTGGQDDMAVLWAIEEKPGGLVCTERCRLTGHTDSVVQVAFSNDGVYAATAGYDGVAKIWSTADGSLVQTLEGPSKELEFILWHPKGHAILAGSNDTMAWMWWAPTGKLMQIFAGHAGGVSCACWGFGGKLVVTGSDDKGVIVWNPRMGSPQQHFREVHEAPIISICSHPESPIVVTGAEDATAKVLQIETGKMLAPLPGHIDSVEAVAFSNAQGNQVLLMASGSMDGKVIVWDGKTFEQRCILKDHVEQGGIVKYKWLPGSVYGNWMCTCSTDQTVRLFNALAGQCLRTLSGHSETVMDLDLSLGEDGGSPQLVVASASEDNSCRIFVVALWTAGQLPEASGTVATTAFGAGYGAQAAAANVPLQLPSPAVQATSLEGPPAASPGASPGGSATPSASPGVPRDLSSESPQNLPV